MALDAIAISMLVPHLRGADVLCLGWPDMPSGMDAASWFASHKVGRTDCVDVIPHKGFERIVDLNDRQDWPRRYDLVIDAAVG